MPTGAKMAFLALYLFILTVALVTFGANVMEVGACGLGPAGRPC